MAAVTQSIPDDDQDEAQENEIGMIMVTLGKASFENVIPGGARAFHDRDERHPDGEIWVRAGKMDPSGKQIEPYVVKCFRTAAVAQAIADRRLREVPATTRPSPKPVSVAEIVDRVNVPAVAATADPVATDAAPATADATADGAKAAKAK